MSAFCIEMGEESSVLFSQIHKAGFKLALDDFGSGLSSFAYLKNLPVDYLKIDGILIKDLENDSVNVTMVKSIIHIGHSMGLKTIAEYVENEYYFRNITKPRN